MNKRAFQFALLLTLLAIAAIFFGARRAAFSAPAATLTPVARLPIVMNGYCASPLREDFSRDNGEWPTASDDLLRLRISEGVYELLFRRSDLFVWITSPYVWDNALEYAIDAGTQNNRAMFGLLYGLHDAGFWTLEIYPEFNLWAHFRFNPDAAEQWTLLEFNDLPPLQASNRLAIRRGTGAVEIYMNDAYLTAARQIDVEPRPLGVVASSPNSGTRVVYDNAYLRGAGCPADRAVAMPAVQVLDSAAPGRVAPAALRDALDR